MWLMTNRGFYSIVEKPWDVDDQTLTCRARTRKDIDRLLEMVEPASFKQWGSPPKARDSFAAKGNQLIEEAPVADYRWRVRLHREIVKSLMLAHIDAIDYDNFKNSVSAAGLHEHHSAYSSVWGVMHRLQEPRDYTKGGGGSQSRFPFDGSGQATGSGGGAVARELGYGHPTPTPEQILEGGFDLIDGEWRPVDEGEPPSAGECPYCGAAVDAEQYDVTGQCQDCDSHLDACSTCHDFLGPNHQCYVSAEEEDGDES